MKVAINRCYGGFGLSKEVFAEMGIEWDGYGYVRNEDLGISDDADYNEYRAHPKLIAAIEKVGEDMASGPLAEVHIVEIPDGISWEIDEYDGIEHIAETHRTWV